VLQVKWRLLVGQFQQLDGIDRISIIMLLVVAVQHDRRFMQSVRRKALMDPHVNGCAGCQERHVTTGRGPELVVITES
jgi:hypothetical protein